MKLLGVMSVVKFVLIMMFTIAAVDVVVPSQAEARAGRGRSSGRGYSFKRQQPKPRSNDQTYSNKTKPQRDQAMGQRSSLLRNIAGGLAGGFLGSMLFSSLGRAAGASGMGGGGVGFLEILFIGGLVYFGLRWYRNRQQASVATSGLGAWSRSSSYNAEHHGNDRHNYKDTRQLSSFPASSNENRFRDLLNLSEDDASNLFFQVQGAWSRGDLSAAKAILTDDMLTVLEKDLSENKAAHRSNRVENIMIRQVELKEAWEEGDVIVAPVRLVASLLDYTKDDFTGQVVEGSETTPVKMEEIWTFVQQQGTNHWQLAGIEQV